MLQPASFDNYYFVLLIYMQMRYSEGFDVHGTVHL